MFRNIENLSESTNVFCKGAEKKSGFVTKWLFTNPMQTFFSQCVCRLVLRWGPRAWPFCRLIKTQLHLINQPVEDSRSDTSSQWRCTIAGKENLGKLSLHLNLGLKLKNWQIGIGFISDETNTKLSAQTNWSCSSACVNKSVKFPDWRRQIFRNRFRPVERCSCSVHWGSERWQDGEMWRCDDDDGKTMSLLRQANWWMDEASMNGYRWSLKGFSQT